MSTGEVVVWCFGIVCATILAALTILVIVYKKDERYDKLMSAYKDIQRELDQKNDIWAKTEAS